MPVHIEEFCTALDEMVIRVDVATEEFIAETVGREIKAAVQAHYPRRVSDSIEVQHDGKFHASVGPTAIYARRLEIGLHRRDSRGRRYHQHGIYYFRRGAQPVLDKFIDEITDVWAYAIGQ